MPWALRFGGKTVRFDDLSIDAWDRVHEETGNWAQVYTSPMSIPSAFRIVLEEAVKVAEPSVDAAARAKELAPSIRKVADLLVEVEDDLPDVVEDGVPKVEDAPPTPT
jgi:hypothetical protein